MPPGQQMRLLHAEGPIRSGMAAGSARRPFLRLLLLQLQEGHCVGQLHAIIQTLLLQGWGALHAAQLDHEQPLLWPLLAMAP